MKEKKQKLKDEKRWENDDDVWEKNNEEQSGEKDFDDVTDKD